MSIDEERVRKFYRATNPDRALFADENNVEEDKKYYIDFSDVRGGQVIEQLKKTITFFSPGEPTCQLFTGHIGCGKSTELLKLKAELENEGFHVVYFESSEELEMSDVDVSDILLAITRRVSQSLEENGIIPESQYFNNLLSDIKNIFLTPINFSEMTLSFGIGQITAQTQASPDIRHNLRNSLEPRTSRILTAINSEILEPSIKKLKNKGKKGLVVIVDSLEKIDNVPKPWKRPQQEYLFIDRGLQLRSLNCHLVYTMPLRLRFSNEYSSLMQRFKMLQVLPMVKVKFRDGRDCDQGLEKLRNMVLARAFPEIKKEERTNKTIIEEVFDSAETLDHLCRISGGHVRNLLRILNTSIIKQMGLPITRKSLEKVIVEYRSERTLAIDPHEWNLLGQVVKNKRVTGDNGYNTLIRSMFVYEYFDNQGSWFDINPILAETQQLK